MSDESVVKQFEQQVGTLKLSQAIRIGAKLRPQCSRTYFAWADRPLAVGSCALGAAWEGAGYGGPTHAPFGYQDVCKAFGITEPLAQSIAIRNDRGDTREQIANWLESQGL